MKLISIISGVCLVFILEFLIVGIIFGGKCLRTERFDIGNETLGASGTYCAEREELNLNYLWTWK